MFEDFDIDYNQKFQTPIGEGGYTKLSTQFRELYLHLSFKHPSVKGVYQTLKPETLNRVINVSNTHR